MFHSLGELQLWVFRQKLPSNGSGRAFLRYFGRNLPPAPLPPGTKFTRKIAFFWPHGPFWPFLDPRDGFSSPGRFDRWVKPHMFEKIEILRIFSHIGPKNPQNTPKLAIISKNGPATPKISKIRKIHFFPPRMAKRSGQKKKMFWGVFRPLYQKNR